MAGIDDDRGLRVTALTPNTLELARETLRLFGKQEEHKDSISLADSILYQHAFSKFAVDFAPVLARAVIELADELRGVVVVGCGNDDATIVRSLGISNYADAIRMLGNLGMLDGEITERSPRDIEARLK